MVRVEFDYNPYLMEYKIRFNDKEPRINSLIEKYDKSPLQTWINSVPDILYNEMNGYDFDLEFIGTSMDYEEIKKAFEQKGIADDDVRVIFSRKMESRTEKLKDIKELCSWLENNRNRRFDYDEFKNEKQDIFECNNPIIIIGDVQLGDFHFENAETSVEIVETIKKLEDTELINIPIIIETDQISRQELQSEIRYVLENSSIIDDQVFFFVSNKENYNAFSRVFTDLGIKNPQIISGLDDMRIRSFYEYYPISDYIRRFLSAMRCKVTELENDLCKEKEESEKNNGVVIKKISSIEAHIIRIKSVISALNFIRGTTVKLDCDAITDEIIDGISTWKNKKTIIPNYSDAVVYASQFENEAKRLYNQFIEELKAITLDKKQKLLDECSVKYLSASGRNSVKKIELLQLSDDDGFLSDIKDLLVRIKDERYEKPREGVLDAFFRSSSAGESEKILVITYSCQEWRQFVLDKVTPQIKKAIVERTDEVNDFCKSLNTQYIAKLEELLEEKIKEKDDISGQLSEDIQILQRDSDWLTVFDDKLEKIERN